MMKKNMVTIFSILLALVLLSSCTNNKSESSPQAATESDAAKAETWQDINDNGIWRVELLHAESTDILVGTSAYVQYDGEVLNVENTDAPQNGYVFLLMELSIEKIASGKASFIWKNTYVEDANGIRYPRHENDSFLSNYNFSRLKATDIKIGSNIGFVCYEVPAEATSHGLFFVYDGDEGQIKVKIPL